MTSVGEDSYQRVTYVSLRAFVNLEIVREVNKICSNIIIFDSKFSGHVQGQISRCLALGKRRELP